MIGIVKNFQRLFQSVRFELMAMCLLLLAVPTLVIGILGYEVAKTELEKAGQVNLKNNVQFVNAAINNLNQDVQTGNLSLNDAQERIKQMILGPKDASGHRPINHNFNLGPNGYIFIVDDNGVELAHPTIEGKNLLNTPDVKGYKFMPDILKTAKSGGGYTTYYWALPNSTDIAPKITYSLYNPNWKWTIVSGTYLSDFNSGANQVLYILLITLGSALLIGSVITWLFANRITKPLVVMAEQAERVAGGDLTIQPVEVKYKNEIGRLAHDFKLMTINLNEIIREVRSSTIYLASSAEELTASAEEVSAATGQIVETIQQVSVTTEDQANDIEEIARTIHKSSIDLQQISTRSELVSDSALKASGLASDGNNSIQKTMIEMNTIHSIVSELAQSVKGLGEHSKMIGSIVQTISAISSQTNLLALNAAIEAARAGEHGRGFSVVADEVRKLAEQSEDSAKQISELIQTIQLEIERVVQSTNKGTQEVIVGIDSVNDAGRSFEQIQEAIQSVASQIQEVSVAVHQVSSGSEQIAISVKEIAEMAETTVSGTQTVSATTEEQLAAMEEITSSAESLSNMAETLQQMVNKFKTT